MRKMMIAGNWKMNKTPGEAIEFLNKLGPIEDRPERRVVLCPTYVALERMNAAVIPPVEIAAQNVHFEDSGAFTGEVSVEMLKEIGIAMTILGHSERREYFNETDEMINKKVKQVTTNGMEAILCVGESLEQRESGEHKDHVKRQLTEDLKNVSADDIDLVSVAYEPIWAIGTGKTATSEEAEEMCAFIREVIAELYGAVVADEMSILYGGSVKTDNVQELMAMENIDGALVGGASLKPDSFTKLVNYKIR